MIAAVTMVYNEPEFLPLWLEYYGRELGAQNLYVVDHGSDDGSTDNLRGANRIRIPRSPQDDPKRTRLIRRLVEGLLEYYGTVIHTDVDEFVVPDPSVADSLRDYCVDRKNAVVTAFGLNIVHVPLLEKPVNEGSPVLTQRSFVRFVSPMCKPVIVSAPVNWSPGFHGCEHPAQFENLFLFHLRYYDLDKGLLRLARTRAQPWQQEGAGQHQRVSDERWIKWIQQHDALPRAGDLFATDGRKAMSEFVDRFQGGAKLNGSGQHVYVHEVGQQLWTIPQEFKSLF